MGRVVKWCILTAITLIVILPLLASCGLSGGQASGTENIHHAQPVHVVVSYCDRNQSVPTTVLPPQSPQPSVYAGTADVFGANLYAFDTQNGAVRWCDHVEKVGVIVKCNRSCPGPPLTFVGKPVVDKSVVYVCVGAYNGYTFAFNASDGFVRWHTMTDCNEAHSQTGGDYETPTVENGIVYTGSYALSASDGSVLWHTGLKAAFGPTVANDVALAYSEDTIYALNADNGKELWRFQTPEPLGSAPTASNNIAFFGTIDGSASPCNFYALNVDTGSVRWCSHIGVINGSLATVSNGIVYVGSSDSVYAFEAYTGKLQWRYKIGVSIQSTPTVAGGIVFISVNGTYALNTVGGTLLWHNMLGANQSTSFVSSVVADNSVFVRKSDGRGNSVIFALHANNGIVQWQSQTIHQASALTVA